MSGYWDNINLNTEVGRITHEYFFIGRVYYRLAIGAEPNDLEVWEANDQTGEPEWMPVGADALAIFLRREEAA